MNFGKILGSIFVPNLYFFRTSSEVLVELIPRARTSTSKVAEVIKSDFFDDFLSFFFPASF